MALPTLTAFLLLFVLFAVSHAVQEEPLYVHLIPHTHDDVGWLKTVDQYYYGANNSIQHAGVQYILDTVVEELQKNPNRTFIYVEIAFFTRWWNQQSTQTKNIVKQLVKDGQLEFVNAGWCMNDEAATHYNAIIDQMTLGLQFVSENFGLEARPRVAWHIDPFGHSSEQAALFALMGFDGFFFARVDYADKTKRLKDSTMEMVWRGSPSLGQDAEIFTGVLYNHYSPPLGFCFDFLCSDPPIQDDPNLEDYNVEERVSAFIKFCMQQAKNFTTNNILLTMGDDFQYEDAIEWYKNLDKLIHYVNSATDKMRVFYSTPSRYVDAVHAAKKTWTVKTDDFFPYASAPYTYWTGYYTSRPALKGYTRECNSLLQVCKQLEVMGVALHRKTTASSLTLQHAMGVEQHHDAISGTEKQHVADDYAKRLHMGQVECQELVGDVLGVHTASKSGSPPLPFQFCEYLNISVCPASETNSFTVAAYNPVGRTTFHVFRFPVHSERLSVLNDKGEEIPSQMLPVSNATKAVRRNRGDAPYVITFTDELPPLGYKMYFVRPSSSRQSSVVREHRPKEEEEEITIDNGAMSLVFNSSTGRLVKITNKDSGVSASVDQQFLWWNASSGNNVNSTQDSNAYIFRPNGTAPFEVSEGNRATITVLQGEVVQEVRQQFNSWVSQVIRLYKNYPVAEFEYTVGPIPFHDGLGKEVISRFSTDLNTDGTWYTDANGREMQKRVLNYRPTWKLNATEPVAENYYPVPTRIYLRDESQGVQFTVLTDRSQGGASLNNGQLELMVHRRLLHYAGGSVEALNETGQFGDGLIIRGRHFVLLDTVAHSPAYHRLLGEMVAFHPTPALLPSNQSFPDFARYYYTNFSGLSQELSPAAHLLTLQSLDETRVLLRLEHQFEVDEPPYNYTLSLSLDDLFTSFKVVNVTELTLGGNAPLSMVKRLHWNTKDGCNKSHQPTDVTGPHFDVTLKPMEIRTFEATVKYY